VTSPLPSGVVSGAEESGASVIVKGAVVVCVVSGLVEKVATGNVDSVWPSELG
jgi:hypothetical protein